MKQRGTAQTREIAPGVHCLPVGGCNVYLVGSEIEWALVDAGWANSADSIRRAAESLFGPETRPAAILITHAHPDHIGSAAELAAHWESPVYAHPADLPYLQGGLLPDDLLDPVGRVFNPVARAMPARLAEKMTACPLAGLVQALPEDARDIPGLPDWEWVHVPGHSPGHVVFFRESDRVLIAGDIVLTAPLWGAVTAVEKLSLPPWPVSWDWGLTKEAVIKIYRLKPRVLAAGHGRPAVGEDVAEELADFAERLARPRRSSLRLSRPRRRGPRRTPARPAAPSR